MTWKTLKTADMRKSGFTLVELLGVVVIVLVFSMLLLTSNRNATQSAQDITVQQQQAQLQSVVEAWIAQQPSIYRAIDDWNDSNAADLKAWVSGPLSLLSQSSRSGFTTHGNNLVTPASSARGKAFAVTWGSAGDVNSKLSQGPIVSLVDK